MSFFNRLKRASKAVVGDRGAGEYSAKGEAIVCPVCAGVEFLDVRDREFRKPFLAGHTTPWLKFDRQVTTLVCTHCAYLMHFAVAPERVEGEGR